MEKKVRILFVINHMNMGGIQKALLQLLCSIKDTYEISLLCINPNSILLSSVPKEVHIIPPNKVLQMTEMSVKEAFSHGILLGVLKAGCSLWSKVFTKRVPAWMITRCTRKTSQEYDVAISYTQPISSKTLFNLSNEVVLNACVAKKKITFVHCDFLEYGGNDACNRSLYRRFDRIAAVSDSVGEKIKCAMPDVADKTVTVYNCIDSNKIKSLADDQPVVYAEKYPVITVARLSVEKGLSRCIPLFCRLREQGYDIRWHIVGAGTEEQELEKGIIACHAEDIVVLHGQQMNPYRYIKNAKLFLLPSFHEAAPVVFDEAQCLGVPILTTPTNSAEEMVAQRAAGWVCDMKDDSIYEALCAFCESTIHRTEREGTPGDVSPISQFADLIE